MAKQMSYLKRFQMRSLLASVLIMLVAAGMLSADSRLRWLPHVVGADAKKKEDEEKKKKEEQKKDEKPDYQIGELQTLPSEGGPLGNFVKPGHAVTASVPVVANNFDFRAELESIDHGHRPTADSDRRHELPLGHDAPGRSAQGTDQVLGIDLLHYLPRSGRENRTVYLKYDLKAARGGQLVAEGNPVMNTLSAYQYLFVVLTVQPQCLRISQTDRIGATPVRRVVRSRIVVVVLPGSPSCHR